MKVITVDLRILGNCVKKKYFTSFCSKFQVTVLILNKDYCYM